MHENTWRIDGVHHRLLRNGKPFFPYGIIMYGKVPARDEADFRLMAEIGFNTVVRWYWMDDPSTAGEYHDLAERLGLLVVEPYHYFLPRISKLEKDFSEMAIQNVDRLLTGVEKVKGRPTLMAYYGFDEPLEQQIEAGRVFYKKIHETDGHHPVVVLYSGSGSIPEGAKYTDWCDILGNDPYWVPAKGGSRGTVNHVSRMTCLNKKRADKEGKVTWIVPFAELWSGIRKRAILQKEQFCQTYLAVINGARGLLYFRYPFTHYQFVRIFESLGKQMALIGPIAVTPDIQQSIAYDPGRFAPEDDEFPDIQVNLRHNPAGGYVLLAANSRYYPVDVTYQISLLGTSGKVGRLFDSQEYPVRNGTFQDRVDFMGTRAYTFESKAPLNGPVRISVKMKPYPNQTDPVYSAGQLPDQGRPGKKNILRNSGFEEAALSDWPDYYLLHEIGGPMLGHPTLESDCGLDTKHPYEGKACFWVRIHGPRGKRFYGACAPMLKEETPYVLSGYMRADRDGVKVRFVGFGYQVPRPTFGYKEFELTTEWERYSENGRLPPGLPHWHSVGVEVLGDQDTIVYFDALQLEKGAEPTQYEP